MWNGAYLSVTENQIQISGPTGLSTPTASPYQALLIDGIPRLYPLEYLSRLLALTLNSTRWTCIIGPYSGFSAILSWLYNDRPTNTHSVPQQSFHEFHYRHLYLYANAYQAHTTSIMHLLTSYVSTGYFAQIGETPAGRLKPHGERADIEQHH
jgi:hypothetical protein